MVNPIIERLNKTRIEFSPCQWESGCSGLYDSVKSYDDIKKLILNDDVNAKIFTMGMIVPYVTDLLNWEEKRELSDILKKQLKDNRFCRIQGGDACCADEEDTTTVSGSARYALSTLTGLEYRLRVKSDSGKKIGDIGQILQDLAKDGGYKIKKNSVGPNHREGYGGENVKFYNISLGEENIMSITITFPYSTTSDDLFDYACQPEISVKVKDHTIEDSVLYKSVIDFFDQFK